MLASFFFLNDCSALDGVVNLWEIHSSQYVFVFLLSLFVLKLFLYCYSYIVVDYHKSNNLVLFHSIYEVLSEFCRSGACLLRSTNCISPQQRWPEDIVWHPDGNTLLSVYSADGRDSQISVTDFGRVKTDGVRNLDSLFSCSVLLPYRT